MHDDERARRALADLVTACAALAAAAFRASPDGDELADAYRRGLFKLRVTLDEAAGTVEVGGTLADGTYHVCASLAASGPAADRLN